MFLRSREIAAEVAANAFATQEAKMNVGTVDSIFTSMNYAEIFNYFRRIIVSREYDYCLKVNVSLAKELLEREWLC